MLTAALTWPQALVGSVSVVMLGVVISVATWQIFRTGQTAIRKEAGRGESVGALRDDVERLRAELGELRAALEPTRVGNRTA